MVKTKIMYYTLYTIKICICIHKNINETNQQKKIKFLQHIHIRKKIV